MRDTNPTTLGTTPSGVPRFLGLTSIRTGGFVMMGCMGVRGLLYLLVAATDGRYFVKPSQVMHVLLYVLGICEILFALYGAYAVKSDDVEKLKLHTYFRTGNMVFLAPYFCGYVLFDSEMIKAIPLFFAALLITVGVLVELVFLFQLYKLILFEMRMERARADEPNRFNYPDWLVGNPDHALVLNKSVPLPLAVSVFAVLTLMMCFMGTVPSSPMIIFTSKAF